jgi:hypothetical protein
MPLPGPLEPEQRRKAVMHCYLTAEQKAEAVCLADAVDMTHSDLLRLFLVTATIEDVERLKNHPAYLAVLMEEATR